MANKLQYTCLTEQAFCFYYLVQRPVFNRSLTFPFRTPFWLDYRNWFSVYDSITSEYV